MFENPIHGFWDQSRKADTRSIRRACRQKMPRSCWGLMMISLATTPWIANPAASQVEILDSEQGIIDANTEADEDEFKGVEEMMVEARRRSENLQKVGESVSSFSANDIDDAEIINFDDLQYSVPSLFSGGGLTKITLRGVGSEVVGPGIDPGFAVHVNGVFSAREGTGLINFFDVEQVDVLRGPQGTLWGRNSTGGAVNIKTKKAVHEFEVFGDAQYEWYRSGADGFLIRAGLNMPIVEDTLALRVALLTTMDDGQFEAKSGNDSQRLGDAAASAAVPTRGRESPIGSVPWRSSSGFPVRPCRPPSPTRWGLEPDISNGEKPDISTLRLHLHRL
jgi:iron complex outermembrane receptor protein